MSEERSNGPVLAIAFLALIAGGAAGWAWRLGESRSAAPPPRIAEDPTPALLDRERSLREEADRLRADPPQTSEEPHVAPKTLDEYLSLLGRLKAGSDLRARWVRRLEDALLADPAMLRGFLALIEAPGERRRLCLALLGEFSPRMLALPDVARVVRFLARDETADEADRVAVLALPCLADWDELAGLAQFSASEAVREAALSRLTTTFPTDARTKRLLEERWWRETDPTGRATSLASALAALDGAGQAELIARAASRDPSPEVRQVAAAQVLSDVLGGSERPMSAEDRVRCCEALLTSLAPMQPVDARRPSIVAILAAGSLQQVEALLTWLERHETDAEVRGWASDAARRIRDARGERDEELLRSLLRDLEPEVR